ncbi:MAG: type II toxin-antitoxin system RelE/ParE family toxin [Magnetococcales bacterium]|nr:type II toxin-antitoxin system RelE/ParE family toxin [Magnetococcales bacterium]
MKIEWLPEALDNLTHEMDYISQDNPHAALQILSRIKQAVKMLENFPNAGRPTNKNGYRELVIKKSSYILLYAVSPSSISIIRLFHTSRKIV